MTTETGFFSDIQSFFDAEYGGRHLAIVLKTLARHEPNSFRLILNAAAKCAGLSTKHALRLRNLARSSSGTVLTEHLYARSVDAGALDLERADLALIDEQRNQVLFEIKDKDHKNDGNYDQLRTYADWCKRNDTPLIHVSRYPIGGRDGAVLASNSRVFASLSFRDIHEALGPVQKKPLARLVREYLEDVGVLRYQRINLGTKDDDYRALKHWARRLLDVDPASTGKTQTQASIDAIGGHVNRLFGNLEYFGARLQAANASITRKFSRDIRRRIDIGGKKEIEILDDWAESLRRHIRRTTDRQKGKSPDESALNGIREKLRRIPDNRYLAFEASVRVPNNSHTYVWFGYYIQWIGQDGLSIGMDGGIYNAPQGVDEYDYRDYRHEFPSEEKAWKDLKAILSKTRRDAANGSDLDKKTKVALRKLSL